MGVSLFKSLSELHPSAVISLRFQYRMHQDIMSLANVVIYDNQMKCGTENTRTDLVHIPRLDLVKEYLQNNSNYGK